MNPILNIWLIWWLTAMCCFIYHLFNRNQKVAAFRKMILDKCYNYNVSKIIKEEFTRCSFRWYYDTMPDYQTMLYSFKPLKETTYHPKELIDEINSEQPIDKNTTDAK